jgi:hypothetical protein
MPTMVSTFAFPSSLAVVRDGLTCGESRVLDDRQDWRGHTILVVTFAATDNPAALPVVGADPSGTDDLAGVTHRAGDLPVVLHLGNGGPDGDLRAVPHLSLRQVGRILGHVYADNHGALRLRSALDGRTYPVVRIVDLGPLDEAARRN